MKSGIIYTMKKNIILLVGAFLLTTLWGMNAYGDFRRTSCGDTMTNTYPNLQDGAYLFSSISISFAGIDGFVSSDFPTSGNVRLKTIQIVKRQNNNAVPASVKLFDSTGTEELASALVTDGGNVTITYGETGESPVSRGSILITFEDLVLDATQTYVLKGYNDSNELMEHIGASVVREATSGTNSTWLPAMILTGETANTWTWTGNGSDANWTTAANWSKVGPATADYPKTAEDAVVIGENQGEITWTSDMKLQSLEIASGSTVKRTSGGDMYVDVLNLTGNATFKLDTTSAFGFQKNLTIDYGTFTADTHGYVSFVPDPNGGQGLWGNGHTIYLTGTLDAMALTGSGQIVLATFKGALDSITYNIDGITLQFDEGLVSLSQPTWDGQNLVINYNEVATARVWVGQSGSEQTPTAWNELSNWSPRSVPTAESAVLFPATENQSWVTLPSDVSCSALRVYGAVNFTGNGGLTVEQTSVHANTDVSNITANLGAVSISDDTTLTVTKDTTITSLEADARAQLAYVGITSGDVFPYLTSNTPCTIVVKDASITTGDLRIGTTAWAYNQRQAFVIDGGTYRVETFVTGNGGSQIESCSQTIVQKTGDITVTGTTLNGTKSSTLLAHYPNVMDYDLLGGSITSSAVIQFGWDGPLDFTVGGGDLTAKMTAPGFNLNENKTNTRRLTIAANGIVELSGTWSDDTQKGLPFAGKPNAELILAGGQLSFTETSFITASEDKLLVTAPSQISLANDMRLTMTAPTITGSGSITFTGSGTVDLRNAGFSIPVTAQSGITLIVNKGQESNVTLEAGSVLQIILTGGQMATQQSPADGFNNTAGATIQYGYLNEAGEFTSASGSVDPETGVFTPSIARWTGAGNDGRWSNEKNWSGESLPTKDSAVEIDLQNSTTIELSTDQTIKVLVVKAAAEATNPSLTLAGAALTVSVSSEFLINADVSANANTRLQKVLLQHGVTLTVASVSQYTSITSADSEADITVRQIRPTGTVDTHSAYKTVLDPDQAISGVTVNPAGGVIDITGTYTDFQMERTGTQTEINLNDVRMTCPANLTFGKATVTIAGENTEITADRYVTSDGAANRPTTVTQTGGTITVNSAASGVAGNNGNGAAFLLAHYPGDGTTYNLKGGSILVPGGGLRLGVDSDAVLTVTNSLLRVDNIVGRRTGSKLTIQDQGILQLGSGGISTNETFAFAFEGGTLVATDDTTVGKAFTVSGVTELVARPNYTLTISQTITGSGTLVIGDKENTGIVKFYSSNLAGFSGDFAVGNGGKLALVLSTGTDEPVLKFTADSKLTKENLLLYDMLGNPITSYKVETNDDGSVTIKPTSTPIWEADQGSFVDSTKWSTKRVPSSEDPLIVFSLTTNSVVDLGGNTYTFNKIHVEGSGSLTFTNGTMVAPIDLVAGTTLIVDAGTAQNYECQLTISGAGKVVTRGNVTMTKPATFTGGLTVESGILSTTTKEGYGGGGETSYNANITVMRGGAVDLNHTTDYCYAYTIEGQGVEGADGSYTGALFKSGEDEMGTNSRQTYKIVLTGDALIDVATRWGLIAGGHSITYLSLNGYTLTKQGKGTFHLSNTTNVVEHTGGSLRVLEGTMHFVNTGSVLTNIHLTIENNAALDVGAGVSGFDSVTFKAGNDGVSMKGDFANYLASTVRPTLDASWVDVSNLDPTTEVTLFTDRTTNAAVTNGFFSAYRVGSRLVTPNPNLDDAATTTIATCLQTDATARQPFFHYDFNDGIGVDKDKSAAADSRFTITSWSEANGNTAQPETRNGKAVHVTHQDNLVFTPYWSENTANLSPLGAGVATIVTLVKSATTDKRVIWGFGDGNGAYAALVVQPEAIAVVGRLAANSPMKTYATLPVTDWARYHFIAVSISPAETVLQVDDQRKSFAEVIPQSVLNSLSGQIGNVLHNAPEGYQKMDALGCYLDDWQVYDAWLTDAEIRALRRQYAPSPFSIHLR